jgi:hypothetical protein
LQSNFFLFIMSNKFSSKYSKFTKIECSMSGKTAFNLTCNVKPISRYASLLNVKAIFNRTLNKYYVSEHQNFRNRLMTILIAQVNVTQSHKNLADQNYREIINLKKVEVCGLLGNVEKFPMLSGPVKWWNSSFKESMHKCPYKVIQRQLS